MAVNLLNMVKQGLPGNFADMAGGLLGESPAATQTALSSALPALLGSIAQQGATPAGAQGLMSLLDNPAVNPGMLGNLAGMFAGGGQQASSLMSAGSTLANSLLGGKASAMSSSLASVGGLKSPQSASNLLALMVPIVLAFIKKHITDNGLGVSGLASLLGSQGGFLQGAMANPAAMVGSLTGNAGAAMQAAGAAAGGTAQRAGAYASDAAADVAAKSGGLMRWLPWIIAAAVVLFILSRLSTCSSGTEKAVTPPPAPPPAATAPAPEPTSPAAATPAPAPDAATAAAAAAASASASAPAATGLPTKIYFDVGQTTLSDAAKTSIADAVDAIKKDSAKVELTGYTDKTGNAAQNEALAKRRAAAVKEALVASGVPEASIGMKAPESITGAANDNEARRVEINKAP